MSEERRIIVLDKDDSIPFQMGNTPFVNPSTRDDDLVENLAAYAHDAWSGWMEYLFSKCSGSIDADGGIVIPGWAVERWRRQMTTAYPSLSEQEKESDRSEARKMIAIMEEIKRMSGVQAPYETSEPKAIPGLTEGRMVHYVIPEDQKNGGQHRAATICRVWDHGQGLCNLHVFWDGNNDNADDRGPWLGSIYYSAEPKPNTWHFMERA